MKYSVVLAIIAISALVAVAVAIPLNGEITSDEQKAISRTRRDLAGIFDSISNGVGGLVNGAKTVSISIQNAFKGIFSQSNKDAMADGFAQFRKGLKDAMTDVKNTMKEGFNKIGEKISGAFEKGKGNSNGNSNSAQEEEPATQKPMSPDGEVPSEETT